MIRYEIKKIFSKSISKVSLVVLLFSLLISCYFAITNVSFLDEQGKSHTGIAAAKSLREEKQKWEGVLDEAALQAVMDEYKKISEEYPIRPGDDSANLLHDSKVQGFSEIKDMINMGFCEFRDFNYYRIDSLSKEEVGQIYENRGKSLEKWLNSEDADGLFDENEKAFLIEQYSEMKVPLYYEDYDGWKSALSYAQTIIMLIMLVSAFLVSGIFSNEFSWKSDSIFFSTKYGRDRGTRAKIMAGFIVVSAVFTCGIGMSWIARWKCHDTDRLLALEIFLQYYLYAVVFAHGNCRIYWNSILPVSVYDCVSKDAYSSCCGYNTFCNPVFTTVCIKFRFLIGNIGCVPRPLAADQ